MARRQPISKEVIMSNNSSFKYSCFISHCHGYGNLMKSFIKELKNALRDHIDPYLLQDVSTDEERLVLGYKYNDKLAKALCQSICMIVVYSPKFEKHSYCLREYAAMEILERRRLRKMAHTFPKEMGMIIPILFRGKKDDIPKRIRDHIHYCDFTGYSLASTKISKNTDYDKRIEGIAEYIHELHKQFELSGKNLCEDCNSFKLPSEKEVKKSWPVKDKSTSNVLPFHEKDK
jgi:TIR domain